MLTVAKSLKWPVTLLVLLIIMAQMGGFGVLQAAATPAPSTVILQQPGALNPAAGKPLPSAQAFSGMAYFAKYDGIDGESTDPAHKNWTEIESFTWGASLPVARVGGGGTVTGKAKVNEFELSLFYDKSASKMLEAVLTGKTIPTLVVELTTMLGEGNRTTFLKYEFKKVIISKYDVSGVASSGLRPTVMVSNAFEEATVTYTEYNADGRKVGDTIVQWRPVAN